jgi:hypothetical protein
MHSFNRIESNRMLVDLICQVQHRPGGGAFVGTEFGRQMRTATDKIDLRGKKGGARAHVQVNVGWSKGE